MGRESEAVEALVELGLTEYESKCFVSLARVSKGTAKEVSDLSGVPRARVYDALDRLHQRGLVDIQQSDPREYRAIPADAATRKLRETYTETLDAAGAALEELQSSRDPESEGAWAISDHEHVTDRLASLLKKADEEVFLLLAAGTEFDDRVLAEIAAAADRGARVAVEVPSDAHRERLVDDVPEASVAVTEMVSEVRHHDHKRPGRALMVDRNSVLLSGFSDGQFPDAERETAIWSEELDHGLVIWLGEILGNRLESTFGEG